MYGSTSTSTSMYIYTCVHVCTSGASAQELQVAPLELGAATAQKLRQCRSLPKKPRLKRFANKDSHICIYIHK